MEDKVLIVGAGPTGLAMAVGLERQGIPFKIIDKAEGPGEESRAMVVHARTLELYDQYGLAENMIERGIIADNVAIFNDGRRRGGIDFGEIGVGLSRFPFVLSLPQDEHERIVIEYLNGKNIGVAWNTELTGYEESGDKVTAAIKNNEGAESLDFDYICGCDGPGSIVRKQMGYDFPGGTYEEVFFVADVMGESDVEGVQVHMSREGFALVLPVRMSGSLRIIGLVPEQVVEKKEEARYKDVEDYVKNQVGVTAETVNWFSTYKVHHRVSEHFRKGKVFLAGDAGHIHSPAGGQGMNTGIGDAMNLSWKLGKVIDGKMDEKILESYEEERIPFARLLVSTTDQVFKSIISDGPFSEIIRNVFMSNVAPNLVRIKAMRRMMFRLVSQIHIDYDNSMLSRGKAGKIKGGDRLPWVKYGKKDNYDPLNSLDFHYHLYGQTSSEMRRHIKNSGLEFCEYNWTAEADKAGVKKNTVMLIRPDGHIAVIDDSNNVERFFEYEKTYMK
ncbi:FAD-dependent monooxygenase [Salinicoccus sp. HZC-1]|uniref:FAD-dependent monooxygenase n=1 Tax=Salinicoccus sp. HZC-1 TaxID=3385497 RepID=UPI00398AEA2F